MSKQSRASTGLSFGSVLFFIFLVMKLMHYIDWSWWWVTAPLWLPITIVLAIFGIMATIGWVVVIVMSLLDRKSK